MRVAEIFESINGEGPRAGEAALFLRFRGCNLRCSYCDTAWAQEPDGEAEERTPEELAQLAAASGIRNVTLTGGEPLLQPEMQQLLDLLAQDSDRSVEIETNGSVDLSGLRRGGKCFYTMDYKLPGSGCEAAMRTGNFEVLRAGDTVKFVCGTEEDLDRALAVIRAYRLTERCFVYLSPVFGQMEAETMVRFLLAHRLNGVRIQLQMHKIIWDPDRRGV